ncbi:unnamed protein product, partial [Laminaria digitata]
GPVSSIHGLSTSIVYCCIEPEPTPRHRVPSWSSHRKGKGQPLPALASAWVTTTR